MIKEVPCMDCDGKGFIAIFSEYSVWSERCPNCGGTGIVKVPMTNADRIRAMSDEELAYQFGAQCPKGRKRECDKRCSQCWLEWLQQPCEGE